MHITIFRPLNAVGALLVSIVLIIAFYAQFGLDDLPCPLCLLQRVAYAAVLYALILNIINGPKPAHYSIMTISAFFGAAVSIRQILLHIVPGTPPYGSSFLHYHYYTWAFIVFAVIILGTSIIAAFSMQYRPDHYVSFKHQRFLCKLAIILACTVIVINGASAFVECGPWVCPANPTHYWLMGR